MYSVILLSGGSGTRMEQTIPKQFLILAGKPIIMHSIERMDQIKDIAEIIIVCHKDYIDFVNSLLISYNIKTACKVIAGGNSRQESSYIGLLHASYKNVIIHEAARPFVKKTEFEDLINVPFDNTTLGHSIPFTVLKGNDYITGLLDRKELVNIQLPQKFNKESLLEAHKKAIAENRVFTEDASLLLFYTNEKIKILNGSVYNVKITEPIDMMIGEVLYKEYIIGRD